MTIAEDEVPDINVESSSRSCTPGSVAADSCSNENSVCSLAATETSSRVGLNDFLYSSLFSQKEVLSLVSSDNKTVIWI